MDELNGDFAENSSGFFWCLICPPVPEWHTVLCCLRYLNVNIRWALSGVVVIQSHHPPGSFTSAAASPVLLWKATIIDFMSSNI